MINHFTHRTTFYPANLMMNEQGSAIGLPLKMAVEGVEVTDEEIALSVDMLFYGLMPMVFAEECCGLNGDLNYKVHLGVKFLKSLSLFFSDEKAYVQSGVLTEFQGKKFSELPHKYRRKLRETEMPMTVLVLVSNNQGKEAAFAELFDRFKMLENYK